MLACLCVFAVLRHPLAEVQQSNRKVLLVVNHGGSYGGDATAAAIATVWERCRAGSELAVVPVDGIGDDPGRLVSALSLNMDPFVAAAVTSLDAHDSRIAQRYLDTLAVPQFSISAHSHELDRFPLFFGVAPRGERYGVLLARVVWTLGWRRVTVLHSADPEYRQTSDAFGRKSLQLGVHIMGNHGFGPEALDLTLPDLHGDAMIGLDGRDEIDRWLAFAATGGRFDNSLLKRRVAFVVLASKRDVWRVWQATHTRFLQPNCVWFVGSLMPGLEMPTQLGQKLPLLALHLTATLAAPNRRDPHAEESCSSWRNAPLAIRAAVETLDGVLRAVVDEATETTGGGFLAARIRRGRETYFAGVNGTLAVVFKLSLQVSDGTTEHTRNMTEVPVAEADRNVVLPGELNEAVRYTGVADDLPIVMERLAHSMKREVYFPTDGAVLPADVSWSVIVFCGPPVADGGRFPKVLVDLDIVTHTGFSSEGALVEGKTQQFRMVYDEHKHFRFDPYHWRSILRIRLPPTPPSSNASMQITVDGVPLSLSVRFASRQQQDETQRQTRIDCSNGPLEAQHNLINYDFQASYRSVPLVPT